MAEQWEVNAQQLFEEATQAIQGWLQAEKNHQIPLAQQQKAAAVGLMHRAAAAGHGGALWRLAIYYSSPAQNLLAKNFTFRENFLQTDNDKRALDYLTRAVRYQNPQAWFCLGVLYFKCMPKDYFPSQQQRLTYAQAWLERAEQAGHSKAWHSLLEVMEQSEPKPEKKMLALLLRHLPENEKNLRSWDYDEQLFTLYQACGEPEQLEQVFGPFLRCGNKRAILHHALLRCEQFGPQGPEPELQQNTARRLRSLCISRAGDRYDVQLCRQKYAQAVAQKVLPDQEVFKWYQENRNKSYWAKTQYALCLIHGTGTKKDLAEAYSNLKAVCNGPKKGKYLQAHVALGDLYYAGAKDLAFDGKAQDKQAALEQYLLADDYCRLRCRQNADGTVTVEPGPLAGQLELDRSFEIGYCYMNQKTGQGYLLAHRIFTELMQEYLQGQMPDHGPSRVRTAAAINNLGVMSRNGWGVAVDWKEAMRLYRMAAELDNRSAVENLADGYLNGEGVAKNPLRAMELYRRALQMPGADVQKLNERIQKAMAEKQAEPKWLFLAAELTAEQVQMLVQREG